MQTTVVESKSVANKPAAFVFGPILGSIALSQSVKDSARDLAAEFYEAQEAMDFCGDVVDVRSIPDWASARDEWAPVDEL